MKNFKLSVITLAIGLLFNISANAELMTKSQYEINGNKIEADHKAAKSACDSLSGNANDICLAEAKGKSKVSEAELKASYKPSTKNTYKAHTAQADADYAVAIEKCDDKAGNEKDVCVKEAKAAKAHALSNAKLEMETKKANATANEKSSEAKSDAIATKSLARQDASMEKRDADFAVAKEKCDALAGNAKDLCLSSAKTKFGVK